MTTRTTRGRIPVVVAWLGRVAEHPLPDGSHRVRDAPLMCAAAFVRAATVSLVGVTLAVHLGNAGMSAARIGVLIGIGLAASCLATILVSLYGDLWGRRRVLVALALLGAIGYLALAVSSEWTVLAPLAFVGMVNGMGRDRGAASALDQAILPQTVDDARRTWALAWYNLVLDAGHAAGALGAAVPALLVHVVPLGAVGAHRLTFGLCAAAMLLCVVLYLGLSPHIERDRDADVDMSTMRRDPHTKRVVTRLSLLFGLDSVGGGFLNAALISYWFFVQYGMAETTLAVIFFAARVLNALSHLGAAWLARRIGLLNTMVWTHLPSSVFLIAAPAAPTATVAALLFLAREALVEMDVPTRQSYVMAVVPARHRTFASGVTNVTRNAAWAVGPTVAGVIMQNVALAGPLVIGGSLKIVYDLLLYRAFRHLRAPEEATRP